MIDDPIPSNKPYVRYRTPTSSTNELASMPTVARNAPVKAVCLMPNLSTRMLATGDRKKVMLICRAPIQAETNQKAPKVTFCFCAWSIVVCWTGEHASYKIYALRQLHAMNSKTTNFTPKVPETGSLGTQDPQPSEISIFKSDASQKFKRRYFAGLRELPFASQRSHLALGEAHATSPEEKVSFRCQSCSGSLTLNFISTSILQRAKSSLLTSRGYLQLSIVF